MNKLKTLVAAVAFIVAAPTFAVQLEPATQNFIQALAAKGGTPIYKLPVAQANQKLHAALYPVQK
jgi:hypothetical protein